LVTPTGVYETQWFLEDSTGTVHFCKFCAEEVYKQDLNNFFYVSEDRTAKELASLVILLKYL